MLKEGLAVGHIYDSQSDEERLFVQHSSCLQDFCQHDTLRCSGSGDAALAPGTHGMNALSAGLCREF